MDLTSPLRSLIPSLDSAVLEVLAGTESGLGASRIARLARRGSRPGVALVLDRLTEHGLVLAEPANQGFMYTLNRSHVLTGAVLLALDARLMLTEELAGVIEHLTPAPVHASLFGSFARGEGDARSDLDLFVLTAHDPEDEADDALWATQLRELQNLILARTGNRLEPLVLDRDAFVQAVRSGEPIVSSLLDEAIRLHGPPLDDLVDEVVGAPRTQRP